MTVEQLLTIAPYDPESAPPPDVVDVMERGLVEIVRRVEIYQSDATTRWNPNNPDAEVIRLVEGSVTVDYNSDERRKLDLTLENIDQKLRPNPNGGLWYDKVIKVFRGVRYAAGDAKATVAIIESQDGLSGANRLRQVLSSMGYDVTILLGEADVADLRDYQFIVSANSTNSVGVAPTLQALYEQGKNILTLGAGGIANLPHYAASSANSSWGVSPVSGDTATSGAFASGAEPGAVAGTGPTGTAAGAQRLAEWVGSSSTTFVTAAIVRNGNGGLWVDIHLPSTYGAQPRNLLRASLDYMRFIEPYKTWETQLGEFYIDGITTPNFPNQVKITARDGTKKLINDKLPKNSTFPVGTSLRDFVRNMASLGGIPLSKMRFNIGSETLGTEMSFERGTSRWDMIKSALESFGYERFFDGFGNFVVRKYIDPTTGPISMHFGTGPEGNLVTYEKSISDSRIYNHVIVTSPPSDEETNPVGYFGEAFVTDVTLPTHKDRIGNRVWPIDAPWLGSDAECVQLASDRLKITALESYNLNFSSIYYPWLEAGEIISIDDPDALDFEPDRFLMDSIAYSLGLGPMSATGKRVTYVGQSGSPDEIPEEGA